MKSAFKSSLLALIMGLAMNSTAPAALITDGSYNLAILPTPMFEIDGQFYPNYGNQATGWKSSFTFGGIPRAGDTRLMSDNDILVGWDGGRGTSVGGDGYAGMIGMTVTGENIAITSFQVDTTPSTAGGPFAQYTDTTTVGGPQTTNLSNMVGTIDAAGNMNLVLDGRQGAIGNLSFFDRKWNYDDTVHNPTPDWASLTTSISSNFSGSVTGLPVTNIGDVNGDLIDDYSLTLVSASHVGSDWGGFEGVPYTEVWDAKIISVVPVPAAVWLFGSGLVGLLGFARRKK